jgi:hypothetical protein
MTDNAGIVTGISVTRNIFSVTVPGYNAFNFHVWNTADLSSPYTQFGQTVISALPASPPAYPYSLCARTVGDEVQFVVWLVGQPRPRWGDPTWGGEATLPSNAPTSGQSGWYAGHLSPGTSMLYTNLKVDGEVLPNP